MRRNKKIFGLIACSAVLAGAVTVGASSLSVAPAAAEGTFVEFEVAKSAQVRYNKDGQGGGIRFAATVSESYLNGLDADNVVLVSSIDKAGNTDTAVEVQWVVKGVINEDTDEEKTSTYKPGYETNTYYHAITFADAGLNVKAAAAVELTATMWLADENGNALTEKQSVNRSMRAVANAVYDAAGDNQTELNDYFGARYTAKKAFKEVGDADAEITDSDWVLDGGVVATAAYNGAAAVGDDLAAGETVPGKYALFDAEYNVYNVSAVTYVTKTLSNESDFAIFDLSTAKIVDGHYAVVKDVTLTEEFNHSAYWVKASGKLTFETNVGFNGVFEGNGHTVTYSFREWGLFGQMLDGAVIQNVHFVATRTTTNCNIATHNGALARSSYGGKVKNVYIQINDSVYNKDRNSSLIGCRYLDKNDYGTTQLIDVIVVATDSNDSYRGGVVFDTDSARNAQTYDNEGSIYVISTNKYMANWAPATPSSSVTASNDTVSGCSVSYSKITRYDRVEALENVEQIGNWVVSNGVISWQD